MKIFAKALLLTQVCAAAHAAPFILPRGVVGAASFTAPDLPGGAIARGAIFTIFGSDLGPAQGVPTNAFPLPEELAGVTVTVTQGSTTLSAIPLFVRSDQINAIMPSNAPLGRVIVRVTVGASSSNGIPATIVESNVGLFTINSAGFGPGIVQNVAADGTRALNTILDSATPGQALILWGTGLGPVDGPDNVAPTPVDLAVEPEVYIGGVRVSDDDLLYAGRSGCCAGLDQLVIRTPLDAPLGCYVPVEIRTKQDLTSSAITMSISETGGNCSDPSNPFGDAFLNPKRVGMMLLYRLAMEAAVDVSEPVSYTADLALSVITDQRESSAALRTSNDKAPRQTLPGRFFFNSMVSLPPPGTCLATGGRALTVVEFPAERKLDAGQTFELTGPGGSRVAVLDAVNSETLGGLIPGISLRSLYLRPGAYQVVTAGGSDVGGFQANVLVPATPDWTNQDAIGVVDRSEPLQIDWNVADAENQLVAVMVLARSSTYQAPAAVLCVENATAGTFQIPSRNLMSLPPSASRAFSDAALVIVASSPGNPNGKFEADGLDAGVGVGFAATGKSVILE